jgi:hypothetical protein
MRSYFYMLSNQYNIMVYLNNNSTDGWTDGIRHNTQKIGSILLFCRHALDTRGSQFFCIVKQLDSLSTSE